MKKFLALTLTLLLMLQLSACIFLPPAELPIIEDAPGTTESVPYLDPEGSYNSKEDVALYIHLYGHLPGNYVTKSQAKANGWSTSKVDQYQEYAAIGGDVFQNREGLLPKAPGRTWTECDIDTWGRSSRGASRIVFSNDGLVYYTGDHYASFELLYGEP